MPCPTARGVCLLAVAATTYVAARLFGTWGLYLLSFAFTALVAVSWVLVAAASRRLTATRDLIPAQPSAGDDLVLRIRLTTQSLLPGLQVTFPHAASGVRDGGDLVDFESLVSRGERTARTGLGPARRGVHRLPAMKAEAEDPLGLVRAHRLLGEPTELTVYPRLPQLQTCVLAADSGPLSLRGRPTQVAPGGSEFCGIRQHCPGEPLSHVDWKSTAKTGALMLREMNDPGGGAVTVLLDGTSSCVGGSPPFADYELAVQAAGSAADFALRGGRTVDLVLHGGRPRRVHLMPGPLGRRQLLETLAATEPDAETPLCRILPWMRLECGPGRATSLWIIALRMQSELTQALLVLRAAGTQVCVVSVDPQPPTAGAGTAAPDASTEALLSLERSGILCLSLGREEDLPTALSTRHRAGPYPLRR
jgi:uncharacterized protein (DUF58 family)